MLERSSIGQDKVLLACGLAVIVVYLFPYFLLGTDSTLQIHDNLDSHFVWYKVLIDSGAIFSKNSFDLNQIMNGVPRSNLPSEFDFILFLFSIFGPFGAYVVNQVLLRLVGFVGMYLLLKQHVITGERHNIVQVGVALCFALLPFWPFGGASVAGIPLVAVAFLNIREKNYAWYNWIILLLYPAYSNLVLAGFFLLFSLGLLWLYDLIQKKRALASFAALLLMSFSYVLTHYRLFLSNLFSANFVQHRVEFVSDGMNFSGVMKEAGSMFIKGQYHAHSLHMVFVLPLVLLVVFYFRKHLDKPIRKILLVIFAYVLLTSLWYGLLRLEVQPHALSLKSELMAFFPMQLDRFHFLHPVLWMILFAISLSALLRVSKNAVVLVVVLLAAQTLYAGSYHELLRARNAPSFEAFYAEKQFSEISSFIGKNKTDYRVVSLGIHPAIAQYNGFYTLDGYLASYPLYYKHQFRKVIAGELKKSERLRIYYDNWGERFYLFSSELWEHGDYVMNRAGNTFEVSRLDIDKAVFHDMGGVYIISAVKINEETNPGIQLQKKFTSEASAWDIYLYKVG